MSRYDEIDWEDRNFDAVKPGVIVQNSHTMRYAEVVEEPDHERVCVRMVAVGRMRWKLEDLTWRRKTMAVAIFNTGT